MEPPTDGTEPKDDTGDWLDRLADGLGEPPLSAQETQRLLRISRDVAHRVQRRATPLAAFLAGVAVGSGVARGSGREAAFDAVLDAVLVRLPDPPEEPAPDG
jgi:hypothetical protein